MAVVCGGDTWRWYAVVCGGDMWRWYVAVCGDLGAYDVNSINQPYQTTKTTPTNHIKPWLVSSTREPIAGKDHTKEQKSRPTKIHPGLFLQPMR